MRVGGVVCLRSFPRKTKVCQRAGASDAEQASASNGRGGESDLDEGTNSTAWKKSAGRHGRRTDAQGVPVENLILAQGPDSEYQLLRSHLEFFQTRGYQILQEAGEKLEYAYFPNQGMISVVAEMSDGRTLEVGVVTRAGFVGALLTVANNTCPYRMVAQPPVEGFRIRIDALHKILPEAPELRFRLARYVKFQALRMSQVAACNRFHEIERRLARWLLMSQDRLEAARLPFTHEFLANMLGTGRASISLAAAMLQESGLIQYQRGWVKVRNRKGLEGAACECYRIIRQYETESGENGNLF